MRADVVIVGAGTTGTAAAVACARRGMSVVCLDAASLDKAGAQWVNGVPRWCFARAGLQTPKAPELRGSGEHFHLVAGWGPQRVVMDDTGVLEVDMRHLVSRLHQLAIDSGVELVGDMRVVGVGVESGFTRIQTPQRIYKAKWVVDASGLSGTGWSGRSRLDRDSLCSAAQEVRSVTDVASARDWFAEQGAKNGDVLCFTGVAGGYSIVNVRLELEALGGAKISILTGSIPSRGHPSGPQLLARFVQDHDWIGHRHFGGARTIPIRFPSTRLDERSILRLGDAAGQVYAMHGSGIGSGLIAGEMLGEVLSGGGDLWEYNVAWQRMWGGRFAASALFAKFSAQQPISVINEMMKSGLMTPDLTRRALAQCEFKLSLRDPVRLLLGSLRSPGMVAHVVPTLRRMLSMRKLYSGYPSSVGELERWRSRWSEVTGESN